MSRVKKMFGSSYYSDAKANIKIKHNWFFVIYRCAQMSINIWGGGGGGVVGVVGGGEGY